MWRETGPSPMSTHVRPSWTLGASRKRKDRPDPSDAPRPAQAARIPAAQPASGSRLLAGYLAHEYLTRGTLLGKPLTRAQTGLERDVNKAPDQVDPRAEPVKPVAAAAAAVGSYYADVSRLLMRADGTHVPGVVNPTQLARWLGM